MEFEHRLRVRFQDVDAAGIIFFSRYFEYAHETYEEWMRAAGLPFEEWLGRAEFGMPLVHAEADFHSPARLGEELSLRIEVERLGETSVSFIFPVALRSTGERRATVRTTHVCIDTRTFRSRPWPERLQAVLAAAGAASGGGKDGSS
jgi:YbgC/YbaW family acyl-CoA thioester hydrolase